MKPILSLETTGRYADICLVEGGAARSHRRIELDKNQPRCDTALAPLVVEVMGETPFSELVAVATASGPGSFSGIRAGCAFARALALSLAIDSFGVDTLTAMVAARCHTLPTGTILALLTSRRPPDPSWWMLEIVGGHPPPAPTEANRSDIEAATANADLIVADADTVSDLPSTGSDILVSQPSAVGVARAVGWGWSCRPARPVYVRRPCALAKSGQGGTNGAILSDQAVRLAKQHDWEPLER